MAIFSYSAQLIVLIPTIKGNMFRTVILAVALVFVLHAAPVQCDPNSLRTWTIQDSIDFEYFVDKNRSFQMTPSFMGAAVDERHPNGWVDPVVYSPNKQLFFVLTRKGDLKHNLYWHELSVYAVKEVKSALLNRYAFTSRPVASFVQASSSADSFRQPIHDVHWSPNSSDIYFIGAVGNGHTRAYRLNIRTNAVTTLTNGRYDLWVTYFNSFEVVNGSIIYYANNSDFRRRFLLPFPTSKLAWYDDYWRSLLPGGDILMDQYLILAGPMRHEQVVGRTFEGLPGPWMSPNGKHAFAVALEDQSISAMPQRWSAYNRSRTFWNRSTPIWSRARLLATFLCIDVQRGSTWRAFDAPLGTSTNVGWEAEESAHSDWASKGGIPAEVPASVMWSRDSRHAILINTALPLARANPERSSMSYIVDYDVEARDWKVLTPLADSEVKRFRALAGSTLVQSS